MVTGSGSLISGSVGHRPVYSGFISGISVSITRIPNLIPGIISPYGNTMSSVAAVPGTSIHPSILTLIPISISVMVIYINVIYMGNGPRTGIIIISPVRDISICGMTIRPVICVGDCPMIRPIPY